MSRGLIVFIKESIVSIAYCIFTYNQLEFPTWAAVVTIMLISRSFLESCNFTNNQGTTLWAFASVKAKLYIKNCYFAENYSPEEIHSTFQLGEGGNGHHGFSSYYFLNCTFLNNYANDGGAVYSSGAFSFHFKNCIFKGNKAFTGGCIDVGAVTAFKNF